METHILRILLIESDAVFAAQIKAMLEQIKETVFEVVIAENFEAGLEQLVAGEIDLALIDLSLPDGAGLANVERAQGENLRIPIIVLGHVNDEAVALEAVHVGAQDYLVKDQLNPQFLDRAIRYAVERQRGDAALFEAEEKYRGIFEHTIEGIFQTTPDGRYLSANPALARIYGYSSPDELINTVLDIGRKLYVEPARRNEFIQIIQERDMVTDFESRIYRKDGSVIWIAENVRAVRNSQGQLVYYEGTVEDITQRKRAEENLRQSEALYHSLVETLPQNIFRKDLQGRFTFVNQRFCHTMNRKMEDIIGKTDFDFFPAELALKYQRDDHRLLEKKMTFETVEQHQPPDGDMFYVQVVKTPIYDANGQVTGLQGIFWDITERKRAEEQIRLATAELARSREALSKKNDQMEEDLKMAREIQQTMLPQQYPTFPRSANSRDSLFQFCHRYLPTGEVGGDYFNILPLSDSEAGLFICDVMGHGVRSALVAAMVRALVEELQPLGTDPGKLLTQFNRDLCAILKQAGSPTLITAFYIVANAVTGKARFANAGHPRPLLLRRSAGKVEPLIHAQGKSNPALGLFESASYSSSETSMAPGDMVMLYTDGLYEVEGANQQLYTNEMLAEAVQRRINLPAGELFDQLLVEIKNFAVGGEFADDVCVVGMELAPKQDKSDLS